MSECCDIKHKYRSDEDLTALKNRLSRIEGQVRGIKKMLDNVAYEYDYNINILTLTKNLD